MPSSDSGRLEPRLRRARLGATAAFATNGALPASLLARYAEVKETLELSPAIFGLLVVGHGLGGALALHLPGVVARGLGVTRAASYGTVWIGCALILAVTGVALGNPWLMLAGLVCAGAGDAVVDVAQNSQGLRVQEAYGRSLLNSMHAGWSIGAALGGGVGTLAALLGVPLPLHIATWAVVCMLAMWCSARVFLPEQRLSLDAETPSTPRPGWSTVKVLIPLAFIALAGISAEDIGNNWSAVLLASERDMAVSSAGVGLTVLLGAQFIGRMVGDRVIDHLGDRLSLFISLSLVLGGILCAAWAPNVPFTLVGLGLAGLGCAITVPIAFARADALPGLADHSGVTWISWAMRTVTITLSPAIGAMSGATSLPLALSVVSCITVAALFLQIPRRRRV